MSKKYDKTFQRIIILTFMISIPEYAFSGKCDYFWQLDSAGRRCGGRAASVRPGGRLGGDGRYKDSLGRDRIYGRDNDSYDSFSNYPNYENEYKNLYK